MNTNFSCHLNNLYPNMFFTNINTVQPQLINIFSTQKQKPHINMLHIYGIKNCNTVKKALDWLGNEGLDYTFHDFKKEPATENKLNAWQKEVSWESLVNRKGTTWRKLSPDEQAAVVDAPSANKVLLQNNSMIKRPIIESPKGILLGFNEEEYTTKLK